jgi:predicted AlkP superfamily phosphohydrolase/phosphomutase
MTLIVWALDSADRDLIERFVAEGSLPNIGALWKNGRARPLGGEGWFDEIGTFVTAWSGEPQTKHGYYGARRLKPGSYELERNRVAQAPAKPFWGQIDDPHFRALIWEPAETAPVPGVNGKQLYNLTVHQESFAAEPAASLPADYLETVRRRLGRDRALRFNRFERPADFYGRLLNQNLELLERKRPLLRDAVREGGWDLIVIGFNELHDPAHLLWGFMDGAWPERDPKGKLADGVLMLYRAVDRAIGEIMEVAPAGAATCVLSPYGMQNQYPTLGLIEDFLVKLGYQAPNSRDGQAAEAHRSSLLTRARHAIPEPIRYAISKRLPEQMQQQLLFSNFSQSVDFRRSVAFTLPMSLYASMIRVNLKDREPSGIVEPGRDYEALLDRIEADLRDLIDPVTGDAAVASIARTAGYRIEGPSRLLPDLFVHWKPARHFMDRLIHPRAELRQRKIAFHRESAHRKAGFIAMTGCEAGPWGETGAPEVRLEDLAPAFLRVLGARHAHSTH